MRIQVEELNGGSAFDYTRSPACDSTDPDESLEVYRGVTLAYTLSSVKWGRCHRIVENNKQGPYVGKYRPFKGIT